MRHQNFCALLGGAHICVIRISARCWTVRINAHPTRRVAIYGDLGYCGSACQPPPRAAISATLLTHCVLCNDSKLCCALRLLFSVVATSR
ncbi:hypothetical protein SAMN06273570_2651 [Candidatus Pantoea floridensis]|uniref:Uncharacterized protein n=1 Tax=Candidatus Pantoea floridensis TaxID=1938870 RepID=A0A286BVU1_9GAMM|nr:hypothetical protein BX596_0092 [Enterobacteriaceae bacterium JKS000233]SOD38256.1 hypothetical protein SAMN06273570_2651 [Pantoea floridensis]